jgi:LuxR family transcriptional regulator, maltose regulon positive regulatory protein
MPSIPPPHSGPISPQEILLPENMPLYGHATATSVYPVELPPLDPWALYWQGFSLQAVSGPKAARESLEQAFTDFSALQDTVGIYTAWCGIVEGYLIEWHELKPLDKWLALFDQLREKHPLCPDRDLEARLANARFSALCLRRPWDPEMDSCGQKAEELLRRALNPMLRLCLTRQLVFWFAWKGNFRKVEALMSEFEATTDLRQWGTGPERIYLQVAQLACYWLTGRLEKAAPMVEEALAEAEANGAPALVHMLLSTAAFVRLGRGEPDAAQKYLDRLGSLPFEDRTLEQGHFQYLKALELVHLGRHAAALRHAQRSLHCAFTAGAPIQAMLSLLSMANILAMLGDYRRAHRHLCRARHIARRIGSRTGLFRNELTLAELYFSQGHAELGLDCLRRGLALGRENRIVHTDWWLPKSMAELCARALEAGIETEFAREIIRINKLPLPPSFTDLETWPRAVHIYTLGRFAMVRDGQSLSFERKAQKRPMELLQALIALGGRQVNQIQLEDALWPNAGGDSARTSFNMALLRLRKIIGTECLRLEEGKLTLDPRFCWVDVWTLQRRLRQVEPSLQRGTPPAEFSLLIQQMMDLLQGPFLWGETDKSWMFPLREKLRHGVRRMFKDLGRSLGRQGLCEQAIAVYRKALEIDPLAEEFYRLMITCYAALDRYPEALAAYHYCRKSLNASLNVSPSPATEALLQAIQQQDRKALTANCPACRAPI